MKVPELTVRQLILSGTACLALVGVGHGISAEAAEPHAAVRDETTVQRVTKGVQVLYDMRTLEGVVFSDLAGTEPALSLKVRDPEAVKTGPSGITIHSHTIIQSDEPARRLTSELISTSNNGHQQQWNAVAFHELTRESKSL